MRRFHGRQTHPSDDLLPRGRGFFADQNDDFKFWQQREQLLQRRRRLAQIVAVDGADFLAVADIPRHDIPQHGVAARCPRLATPRTNCARFGRDCCAKRNPKRWLLAPALPLKTRFLRACHHRTDQNRATRIWETASANSLNIGSRARGEVDPTKPRGAPAHRARRARKIGLRA